MRNFLILIISLYLVDCYFSTDGDTPNVTSIPIRDEVIRERNCIGCLTIKDTTITYPTTTHYCPLLGEEREWVFKTN